MSCEPPDSLLEGLRRRKCPSDDPRTLKGLPDSTRVLRVFTPGIHPSTRAPRVQRVSGPTDLLNSPSIEPADGLKATYSQRLCSEEAHRERDVVCARWQPQTNEPTCTGFREFQRLQRVSGETAATAQSRYCHSRQLRRARSHQKEPGIPDQVLHQLVTTQRDQRRREACQTTERDPQHGLESAQLPRSLGTGRAESCDSRPLCQVCAFTTRPEGRACRLRQLLLLIFCPQA